VVLELPRIRKKGTRLPARQKFAGLPRGISVRKF